LCIDYQAMPLLAWRWREEYNRIVQPLKFALIIM